MSCSGDRTDLCVMIEIEELIRTSGSVAGRVAIGALFDEVDVKLQAANKMVADNAHYLPSFDVRHSQQVRCWCLGRPGINYLA